MLACPASELDEWQARRHRAAVKVQAHWRGLVQRRKLALRSPEMLQREQVCMGRGAAAHQSTDETMSTATQTRYKSPTGN